MYNGGYGMAGGMGMNAGMGAYGGAYGGGGMGGYGGGMGGQGGYGRGGMGGGMGAGRGMGIKSEYGGGENGAYGGGGFGGGSFGGGGARGPPQAGGRHDFVEGKLFLGGLDTQTSKETLVEYVTQWGELADYVLMEGRGFGFVTFSDPAGAQTFLEHREHIIDGKRVEAKAAVPRNNAGTGNSLTKKMFVGGTGEVKDDDFRNYFEQFGEIDDCVVLRKPDGGSRGFGFVTYKDEISVEKCLVMQHQLGGRTVELKRAIKKDEMAGGGGGYGGGDGGYGGGGAGGPMRTGKQPDWVCPSSDCRNKNFGWREQCNRCQIQRPANPELAPARPGAGGGGGAPYQARASSGYEAGGMGGMGGMSMGMGGMGMGMNPYQMGMGAMGGMGGYGMGAMAGMGMGGGGGGYGAGGAGSYGNGGGQGYGRASGAGRGAGATQGRYRPY